MTSAKAKDLIDFSPMSECESVCVWNTAAANSQAAQYRKLESKCLLAKYSL